MQDCVIGCFSGYAWEEVRVWARSLRASGFPGRKVALVRAPGPGCMERLMAEGCTEAQGYLFSPPAPAAEAAAWLANVEPTLFKEITR